MAGGTIVIYDNLPVLALSASLSPKVMPRQIILSDVIPQEEGVIGALELSRVRTRHNVPKRRLSFKPLIDPIVHTDPVVVLALLHIRSFDINAALFLVDARPLMCHEAVLTRLRPIATLIPALHD